MIFLALFIHVNSLDKLREFIEIFSESTLSSITLIKDLFSKSNESGSTNIQLTSSDNILDIEGKLEAIIGLPADKYSNNFIGEEYSEATDPPLIVKSELYGIKSTSDIAKKLGISIFLTCPVKRTFS